jgi:tRNA pseudouridine55 synthase
MAQFRTRKAPLDGVLLIDKPVDFTSHDVVARVRRDLRPGGVKKVGHAGTLDPFATGLLVVLIGRATKLARFFVDLPKEYECTVRFGVRSDTGDLTGLLSETGVRVTAEDVDAVVPRFLGPILQRVPMTSAVKVDGERLYKKAHRGETVETPVKEVEISALEVLSFDEAAQAMRCRIGCSKGTYVRQLAIDLGEAVGAGAHLEQLSRTAIGELRLDDAQTLAVFEESVGARDDGDEHIPGLVAPASALQFMPSIELSAAQVAAVRNGARLPGGPREPVRLTFRGELVAVYGPAEEGNALKLLVKL